MSGWTREQGKRRNSGGLLEAWAPMEVEVPFIEMGKVEDVSLEGDEGLRVGHICLVRGLEDTWMDMSSKRSDTWIWGSGQR